ncbi:MAG TPA: hypothetical protein VK753_00365, partial [Xanthomonadaceae bacterium]|nr:hypothetical protein [Xanthomonadaceae bacterium]
MKPTSAMKCRLAATAFLAISIWLTPCAAAEGFSDTSIGFRYGPDFSEPGVIDADGSAAQIGKRIANVTHVDGS